MFNDLIRFVCCPSAHSHMAPPILPAGWPLAVAAGRLPPVVVLSRRGLSTSPSSPEMLEAVRLASPRTLCVEERLVRHYFCLAFTSSLRILGAEARCRSHRVVRSLGNCRYFLSR
jgi:hypothetical protein